MVRAARPPGAWILGRIASLDQSNAIERSPVGGLLSRRQVLQRATALGIGGLVLSALPAAERFLATVEPALATPTLTDATLQAVADTLIPGARADRTDLGNEIHP